VQITITDHYNRTSEGAALDEVLARSEGPDHWQMLHTLFMDAFDEYFTSDVFRLIREMVAPIH
jgi:hypothetical protein